MPCRDYEDDNRTSLDGMQNKCDKLARIACKALTCIEEAGAGLEFLILKDPEIAEWWSAHKEADRKEQVRLQQIENKKVAAAQKAQKRAEIMAKLTNEERQILGIK